VIWIIGSACFIAGCLFGWRMGYGIGFDDGDLWEGSYQSGPSRRFCPWPWSKGGGSNG